jgi:hypothetical protein
MSFRGYGTFTGSLRKQKAQARLDKLVAQIDAVRAARPPGHKSRFRRLFECLRPHRQEAGDDSHSSYGTVDNPGR